MQASGVMAILVTPFTDDDCLDLPGQERVVDETLLPEETTARDAIRLGATDRYPVSRQSWTMRPGK
jgi:hypothetical protein